ncbi:hypothetical protein NQ317_001269 [Molorchus minor]|uniref:Peptidase S1 domain-containing protein n=1 Tax=Molorchus minor TaxID=1323400 RepID=A0ABQ9IT16_9CUCU|nr:hypothetical protein NQ317_001269 [Molorchus minor]
MKVALVWLFALLGCVLAIPNLDWSKIEPLDVHVEPSPNAPVYANPRVIGGVEAQPGQFPYQAALIINLGSFCGGILISNQWVLSAAHCTVNALIVQVILGAHNVNQAEANQVAVTTTRVTNHPQYNTPTQLANDVSIIELPSPRDPEHVHPTDPDSPSKRWYFRGSDSYSERLGQVDLTVLTNQACANSYNIVIDSHICTSGAGVNWNVGACNGDSGGPLVVGNTVVGIVSFGSSQCAGGNPTAYARVSSFANWINQVTGV